MNQANGIPYLSGYSNEDGYELLDYVAAGDVTSEPIMLANWQGYSLTVSWPSTGSPAGTVKLQGCNDIERNWRHSDEENLVNWFDIDGATSELSSHTSITIEHPFARYRWLRMVYTRTSGEITITCKVQLKG